MGWMGVSDEGFALGIQENNAEHPTNGSGEDLDSPVHHKNKYLYESTSIGVYTVSGHCAKLVCMIFETNRWNPIKLRIMERSGQQ
jgi:hypothetical protein